MAAYLVPRLFRGRRCDDCDARAQLELLDGTGWRLGAFCRRCGNRRLEGLLRREGREDRERREEHE